MLLFNAVTINVYASSEKNLSDKEAFTLLKKGFSTQLSLSEQIRSLEEIEGILNPYFTKEFSDKFLDENLFEEEAGYIVYGSDFAPYYIPYFTYSDKTLIVYDEQMDHYYVYEKFEENNDGPVIHGEFYGIVTINRIEQEWKISDITIETELSNDIARLSEPLVEEIKTISTVPTSYGPIAHSIDLFNIPFSLFGYQIQEMEYPFQRYNVSAPF